MSVRPCYTGLIYKCRDRLKVHDNTRVISYTPMRTVDDELEPVRDAILSNLT